jgi:DDE superfamily endonuclease
MGNFVGTIPDASIMNPVLLSGFCDDIFSSFSRSDQRRWGETYVRGLASVPGRKSIRRISDHVVGGRADQCLQQFVNQSPWAWQPVRRALAQHVTDALRPAAWVVKEVVFPKNGASSVGVARQYAGSAGRTLNCQLGLAVFLAGEEGASPVNWRLLLPQCWDADAPRRARTHLPPGERSRPRWQSLLDALDEMTGEWGLPPMPVVADLRHEPQVSQLVPALEDRGLPYALRVAQRTPALSPGLGLAAPSTPTVGEIATRSAARGTLAHGWKDYANDRIHRSQFATAALPRLAGPAQVRTDRSYRGPRQVVGEWLPQRRSPKSTWLARLDEYRLPDLIGQLTHDYRVDTALTQLSHESGLHDFEGRSFRGWHHHVTLVSAVDAYRLLCRR